MNYWQRNRPSRRAVLRGAGVSAAGLAGAVLIGCGDSDDNPTSTPAADGTAAGGGGGSGGGGTDATATATAEATPMDGPQRGGTVRWSGANLDFPDIHQGTHVGAENLAQMSLDGLWQLLEPEPGDFHSAPMLAEALEQPDDLTYTFTIRQGAMFQPPVSRPFTSEDAKFSLERMATDDPRFTRASWLAPIVSYETPDENTLTLRTEEPVASLLDLLSSPWTGMVAKEQVDIDGDQFKSYIGTGPYVNERADVNNEFIYSRFEDYWGEGPWFDRIELNWIPEDAAEQAAFRAGEIQSISGVPTDNVENFASQNPDATQYKVPSAGIGIIAMNNRKEPYNDVRVRRAIALASDIPGWIDVLVGGEGFLTGPIAAPFKRWALQEADLKYHDANAAEAKKLFDAAVPGGFTVNALSIGNVPTYIGSAVQMKADLEPLGITVEVESGTQNDYVGRLFVSHEFDVVNGQDFSPDDPDRLFDRLHSEGSGNYAGYANAEVDRLLEEQRRTIDLEARQQLVFEAERIIIDEVPTFYTYVPWNFDFSREVSNWRRSAITANDERWNARHAYFTEV